jgi:hypothetical protein
MNAAEQGMGFHRLRLVLRMELAADEPGMVFELDISTNLPSGEAPVTISPAFLELRKVLGLTS